MNNFIIIGNWKMNMVSSETIEFFEKLKDNLSAEECPDVTRVICPTFPLLSLAVEKGQEQGIFIGSQDVSSNLRGAYTGEVSVEILKSIGVKYTLIGHSERRQYHKETNKAIMWKWAAVRKTGMIPIVCIGETLEERERGDAFKVISKQLYDIFCEWEIDDPEDEFCIAYEPVWAIGTGKTATPEIAQEIHQFIRETIANFWGYQNERIPLLYGGSVKSSNIKELLCQKDINGALVGGASLDPTEFALMVKYAQELI